MFSGVHSNGADEAEAELPPATPNPKTRPEVPKIDRPRLTAGFTNEEDFFVVADLFCVSLWVILFPVVFSGLKLALDKPNLSAVKFLKNKTPPILGGELTLSLSLLLLELLLVRILFGSWALFT